MPRTTSRRRGLAAAVVAALAAGGLSACGSSGSSGPPTLTWFINPDVGNADPTKGGQAQLAQECAKESGGRYKVRVELLPNEASDQRQALLRRLAADDPGMDLMSVDPAFVSEFAAAGYFAPVPSSMQKDFTDDRVKSSLEASRYQGKLIAVPFWSNTQLLWYRKGVAKKAGLDMTKPVTWQQVVAAAKKTGTTVGVQAKLYEGYSVWINALVEGGGGQLVQNPNASYQDLKMGLDSKAGREAAGVIRSVATSGVAGPAMGSSTETESLALFDSKKGSGFLVNWPYTYGALTTSKSDVAVAPYPRTDAQHESKPPYGGIQLAVGKKARHPQQSYELARCVTSQKHQTEYMAASGNPASRRAAYKDPSVLKAFPNGIAAQISASLDRAAPRPLTPYWGDISTGLQQRFSPPGSVDEQTPAQAQKFILQVLNGKRLL